MDQIAGVLPLAWVHSKLFGNALVSTPFCAMAVLSANPLSDACWNKKRLKSASNSALIKLELRYREPQDNDWLTRSQHATFGMPLAADDAAMLAAIKKNQRALIRKGLQSDLSCQIEQRPD